MRERLKKPIAIIMGVILVLTLTVTPMDVRAYTETGGTITLGYSEEVTVKDSTSNSYKVVNGSTLIIADGATVSGNIELEMGGTLTINAGCYVNSISTTEGGSISNLGTISGTVTLVYATLTNFGSGSITGEVSAGMNATVENSGTINKISANNATITNYNTGTITDIDVVFSTLNNKGTIETCSIDELAGSCTINLEATSKITKYISPLLRDDFSYKITASEGAKIENAKINVASLNAYGGSTGTLTISNSLELSGTTDIPSGLTMAVGSDTQITSSGYSGWHVSYGGNSYLLPASGVTGKTISDLYSLTTSKPSIEFSDLEVGYGTAEISQTAQTLTLSNLGMCDMKCKITNIPTFIEIYNGEDKVASGTTISLAGSESTNLSVKAKTGNSVSDYSEYITLEKYAVCGATDVLMSEEDIPVTLNVNRKPGSGTVTVSDVYYGTPVSFEASSLTNDDGQIVEFKKRDASDDTYSTEEPIEAGEYTARAWFFQTDIYKEFMAYADFAILRKTGAGAITVSDIYYGETLNPTVTSSTNGTDAVTIQYKQKGAADDTYTTTVPTKAGEYIAQATFAQTEEYLAVVDTADFKILRKTGAGTITVEDIYYGETLKSVAASDKNGTANVTFEYKKKGAPDSSYTTAKPTKAGDYTVRATFAQTDEFLEATATDDFAILRKAGAGTITVADICYGVPVNPVVSSDANGTANVTIEYKKTGAPDNAYSQTKPSAVGEYTARATFAMTDGYLEASATDDFVISYLKAPESPYTISGKKGSDDYYISVVTITPAEGYLIADSLDGTYKKTLTVGQSAEDFNIFLKKASTGEKTAGIAVSAIKVDREAPAILNAKTGEKMYGEQVEITIKDDNLAQVLVNGEAVEIENHMAILQLSSNLGEETYEITCIDVAGNTSKTTVVVAADWMKDRMIPEGSTVRLSTEYSYQLGGGTWQVQGDGTSYAGGSTFYVTSDGEYTFTKIN